MKAFKHDSATIDPMTNYWPTSDLNVYNLKYIVSIKILGFEHILSNFKIDVNFAKQAPNLESLHN